MEVNPTTPRALLDRFRRHPLRFVPGSKFEYSNSGYVALGLIIERVSGESYPAFIRHYILDVLHLANTGYDSQAAIIEHRAQGYVKQSDTLINAPPIDPSVAYSAGALYSTVDDLMTWDEALYTDELIPSNLRQSMFTAYKGVVGYGWAIGTLFNRRLEHHNGEISGFVSNIARFPDQHVLIVVLSNRDGTQVDNITKDLAAITFGESYEMPTARTIVTLAPALYGHYVGTYRITADIALTISRRDNGLEGRLSGSEGTRFRLVPLSEVHFVSDTPPVDIVFALDPEGRATDVTVNGAYKGKRLH
jgi:CubicO group peptidase (beta-lactamase class C family)